jgi:hypothetical protein
MYGLGACLWNTEYLSTATYNPPNLQRTLTPPRNPILCTKIIYYQSKIHDCSNRIGLNKVPLFTSAI